MKYLAVLLVSSWLGYAYSCSCIPQSDDQKFCNAEYGVLIKTEDDVKIGGTYKKIKIKLLETFKSQAGERKVIEKFLFTNKGGSLCGVDLKADTYYIVTGYYADIVTAKGKKKKTRMVTGSCDYIKEIKDMSPPTCTAEKIKLVF